MRGALLLAVVLVACAKDESTTAADAGPTLRQTGLPQTCRRAPNALKYTACNGAEQLCDRTYDRVVVPMTHNAMSNRDDGWSAANQTHDVARQLADGVRGMMLDVHYADPDTKQNSPVKIEDLTVVDQVHLCHGSCLLGRERLLDDLCAVGTFLDQNPGEVLSVVFETKVADADLDGVLRASGLANDAFVHAPGTPWPTLRAMIEAGKRFVVFVETGGGMPPYLHPAFVGNIRDTPYTFQKKEDFTCSLNRGAVNDPLFLVNHWLGGGIPDVRLAVEANSDAVLGKRVDDCTREIGRPPTFVGVDFYEVGALFDVVRRANGL